ncbi:MAG: S9 family peptidase [Methanospirillaceae archaeon]|nr:S9 family peptidase [Methanospirillaceae archaeon]
MSRTINPVMGLLSVFFLIGLVCPVIAAQDTNSLSIDDILQMEYLHHFSITPNGNTLLYHISHGDDLNPPQDSGRLWMISLSDRRETLITDPGESVIAWALSPDGSKVAYTAMSLTGGDTYLSIYNLYTGVRTKMDSVPDELLSGFSWLGSGKLAFLGASPDALNDTRPGKVIIMDTIPDPVVLKSYHLTDGSVSVLTGNNDVIYEYAPSPDGRYILYKAAEYPESWLVNPVFRYIILEVSTGREDELFILEEGYQDENEFTWAPDSSKVYIERMQNGGMSYPVRYTSDILVYSLSEKTLTELPLQWERKLLKDLFNDDVEITPFDKGVYVLLADGTNPTLARYTLSDSGWDLTLLSGEHQGNIFALETTSDGATLYYNYNSASVPPQIYTARVRSDQIMHPLPLTDLNSDLLTKPLGSSEVIEWTGALGETIQGVIRYPPGYSPATRYPLVVVIHGGPTYTDFDSWRDGWEFPYHLLTDAGFITLSPNYHGSSNFGFLFAESIEGGRYYDLPIEDIQKGVSYLAEKGIIDPERVGSTGWSNGGILSIAWATRDPSLKAAVVGAGYADENSQLANTNGMVMNRMYHNKTPFEDPEAYIPVMGVYHAGAVQTPILMFQGTKDNSVVPAGAISTYRAYKQAGNADVQMILFVDEPHHCRNYPNQQRKVMEEIAWLTRGLLPDSS